MNVKSLPQLLDTFKDEATCVKYFENLIWGGKPVCPHCKSDKTPYTLKKGYKCSNNECYKKFTVKVGTVLESSKIPLRTWFAAVFLATCHKKGISSVQLALDLNVTQKTAWFMLHRIREMLKDKTETKLSGIVEIDEAHIGGLEPNRHKSKRQAKDVDGRPTGLANDGTIYNKKKTVIAVIERGGKVVVKSVSGANVESAKFMIDTYIQDGSDLMTDESPIYVNTTKHLNRQTVNHGSFEFVNGTAHTNTVENFFSVLKRAIYGTYHQVSAKHLPSYLNECAARFNNRDSNPYNNIDMFLSNSRGYLAYKNLIAK